MSPVRAHAAEDALRVAVESRDYRAAAAALDEYLVWFHSAERSPEDVLRAKEICERAAQAVRAGRMRMSAEFAFLDCGTAAIGPHSCSLDG